MRRAALPSSLTADPPQTFPRQSFTSDKPSLTDAGFDLLCGLLTYDPKQVSVVAASGVLGLVHLPSVLTLRVAQRLTAAQALAHPYFSEQPPPQSKSLMPTFPSLNESSHRVRKRTASEENIHQILLYNEQQERLKRAQQP